MAASPDRRWLALALISAVQFMVVLDIAIVNVALPSIKVDLGFSQENLQWVISAYALVFGGFLLLGGRSADLLGRRRVFMVGTVVFTLGSLLCGLAWSEQSLIAFRAFQGLGAATITPAALSILVATFAEGRERNIALGGWGAVGGVGAAFGVLFGGILVDFLSWPWIFFVNVPVGIIVLVWPNISSLALLYVIGAYAIVLGIIAVGGAFWLPIDGGDTALMILSGLVSILFGIVIFAKPGAGALVTLALIAAFALVSGITELIVAIGGKRLVESDLKRTFAAPKAQPSN